MLIVIILHCYHFKWSNGFCLFRWEPDPVEADPLKGGRTRRKVDILGMLVSIIGSKDQLVNEYRVMLAEKLLNKSDYDIDSEIRTLELLKVCVFHPSKPTLAYHQNKKGNFSVFSCVQIVCLIIPLSFSDSFWRK